MQSIIRSSETVSKKQLLEDLNSYVSIDNKLFYNVKNKTNYTLIEKSDVIQRLNHSIICNNIIFHNLKNEIEYEYEFFEENIKEINKLVEKGNYQYALKLLDYLDEFIHSLRKNIY
ncbi:MAG: hypothetical protein FWG85_08085 [Bacteroidetes bacterium]|nr:hypothetical protein [Bacteroidota bacterium]